MAIAEFEVEPREVHFGEVEVGRPSPPRDIQISNETPHPTTIQVTSDPHPCPRDFKIDLPETLLVRPGAQSTILVSFSPRAFGDRSNLLRLKSTGPGCKTEVEVHLSGIGCPPERMSLREIALRREHGGTHFALAMRGASTRLA